MSKVGNPNIKNEGKKYRWKKGQSGNPAGRPRKLISDVIIEMKKQGVKETSQEETRSLFLRLMNYEIEEVESMVKDKKSPALLRIVGEAVLSGKGFEVVKDLLDRSIGKPTEKIEHSGEVKIPPIFNLDE